MPVGSKTEPTGIFYLEGMIVAFNLDEYIAAADEKYATYEITVGKGTKQQTVTLRNPLRIAPDKQAKAFELIDQLGKEKEKGDGNGTWAEVGADDAKDYSAADIARMQAVMIEFLELVGSDNVKVLTDRIADDFAVLQAVFQDYAKQVGLGEASSSED